MIHHQQPLVPSPADSRIGITRLRLCALLEKHAAPLGRIFQTVIEQPLTALFSTRDGLELCEFAVDKIVITCCAACGWEQNARFFIEIGPDVLLT